MVVGVEELGRAAGHDATCTTVPRARRFIQFGRRAFLVLMALPLALRVVVIAVVMLALWSVVNWTYQVVRKPTELFFPVSGALSKTPPASRPSGSGWRADPGSDPGLHGRALLFAPGDPDLWLPADAIAEEHHGRSHPRT